MGLILYDPVECISPHALDRQNGILRAVAILDIITDAFCE